MVLFCELFTFALGVIEGVILIYVKLDFPIGDEIVLLDTEIIEHWVC